MNNKNYSFPFKKLIATLSLTVFVLLASVLFAKPATAEIQIDTIRKMVNDKLYKTAATQLKLYLIKNPDADYAKLLLGQTLFKSKQYDQALEIFKNFYFNAKENGYTETAAFYLGEIQYYQGNYPRAIKYYQEIIQNYQNSKHIQETFLGLGNAYRAIKKYQEAESSFNTVIAAKDIDYKLRTKAALSLAKLYYEQNKFKKAQETLEQNILEEKPNIEIYFLLAEIFMATKDYAMAIKYYKQAQPFALKTDYTEDILFSKALAQFMTDDFKGSSETFALLLKNTTKQKYLMQGYLLGGESFFRTGKYKKSLKLFKKYHQSADSRDPNKDKILYFIGENLSNLRSYLSAIKYYKEIANNYQESRFYPLATYGIGWAYYRSENFLEGIDYLRLAEKAFVNTEQKAQAKLLIAESFNAKKDYENAATEFDDMLKKYPDLSWKDKINYRYGLTFYQAKKYKEAINIWQKMQILHAGSYFGAKAAYKTAWAIYKQGQLKNATTAFNSFISNYPNSYLVPFALLKKANILYMLNQYNEAIINYKKIIDKYPDSIPADRAGYEIGWCYYLLKDENFAEKYFDKYLTKNPSSTFRKDILFWVAQNHYNAADYELSARIFKKISQLYANQNIAPRAMFWQGKSEAAAKDNKTAINTFQEFIERHYKHPLRLESTVEIADIFYSEGQYDKARNYYHAIIDNYPKSYLVSKCYLKTADCFFEEGDLKEALKYYNIISSGKIQASPTQRTKSLLKLAKHYIATQETDTAISKLVEIIYNCDVHTPLYGEAGIILADILENEIKDKKGALRIYQKLSVLKNETGYRAKQNIKRLTGRYFIKN